MVMGFVRLLLAAALAALVTPAWAQCSGLFPAGTVCGNTSASPAVPSPVTFPSPFPLVVGTTPITSGTDTRVFYDNAGVLGEYSTIPSGLLPSIPSSLLPAGVNANVLSTKTANYTIAAGDCGSTIQAGTGSTGIFTVTLPSVSGFSATCSVVIANGDTARGKRLSGFPSQVNTILWPLQTVNVAVVNGAWAVVTKPDRWRLTAATTLNIDSVNGSNSNDGLATGSGNALLTIQGAANIARDQFDLNSFNVTILGLSGQTYTTGLALGNATSMAANAFVGSGRLILDLGTGTLSTTSNDAITAAGANTPLIQVQNLTIQTTTSGHALYAIYGGQINIGTGTIFGATASNHINAQYGGFIRFFGDYAISGGAQRHYYVDAGGAVLGLISTVTLSGTPAFSTAFLVVQSFAAAHFGSVTFSGAATGQRYKIIGSGGNINTEGGGSDTYFPGDSAGTVGINGFYDKPGTPTVASCGTSPSAVTGTDFSGKVTEGTTATGCVVTFKTLFANAPNCTANLSTGAAVGVSAISVTAITFVHASLSSNVLYWTCPPN